MNPESEQDQEIFQIWKDYGMEGNFDVCRTAYSGWYPNVGEFGYEIMSNLYDIPEYLEPYIDYAKFGKVIKTAEVDLLIKSFCEMSSKVNINIGIVSPVETAKPSVFPLQVATKNTVAAIINT